MIAVLYFGIVTGLFDKEVARNFFGAQYATRSRGIDILTIAWTVAAHQHEEYLDGLDLPPDDTPIDPLKLPDWSGHRTQDGRSFPYVPLRCQGDAVGHYVNTGQEEVVANVENDENLEGLTRMGACASGDSIVQVSIGGAQKRPSKRKQGFSIGGRQSSSLCNAATAKITKRVDERMRTLYKEGRCATLLRRWRHHLVFVCLHG